MTRLVWGSPGQRTYQVGLSQGVFYPQYGPGVVWPGLVSISWKRRVTEPEILYLDGVSFLARSSREPTSGTVKALSAPDPLSFATGEKPFAKGVFAMSQELYPFGLSYVTLFGNDTVGETHGQVIHLAYNCLAWEEKSEFQTHSRDVGSPERSWSIFCENFGTSALYSINSTKTSPQDWAAVQDIIYGTSSTDPRMLTAQELTTYSAEIGG